MYLKRLLATVPIMITTVVSLLLLVYVGYGETLRTAAKFEKEKLQVEGEIIQVTMERFLQAGLPLDQFIGFDQLSQSLLASDPTLSSVIVRSADGKIAFQNSRTVDGATDAMDASRSPLAGFDDAAAPIVTDVSTDTFFRLLIPLHDRFEVAGSVEIDSLVAATSDRITARFTDFAPILIAVLMITFLIAYYSVGRGTREVWIQEATFVAAFLSISALVLYNVILIYVDGVQSKSRAMADSLSTRLEAVAELGLAFDDISGLEEVIAEYKALNPDIKDISVTFDDRIGFHTQPDRVGLDWTADPDAFEQTDTFTTASGQSVLISVGITKDTVYKAVLLNIKSFAALFVATCFLAVLFIQLAGSFHVRRPVDAATPSVNIPDQSDLMLGLIKPIYLIGVLVEMLNASFLPQYLREIVGSSTMNEGSAALIFSVFFMTFAAVLVPAGKIADRHGARPLLLGGALLSAAAPVLLALAETIEPALIARAIAGAGQGLFLIGVQSFILKHAAGSKTTQGAGIIVYGYNGGMISGAAIGALLSVYMGADGVLFSAGLIGIALIAYIWFQIPQDSPVAQPAPSDRKAPVQKTSLFQIFKDLLRLFRDPEFLKTILLIGIPTKAVLSGVSIYALPLILSKIGFGNDSIGQVIMFYAGGVLLASHFISKRVDRQGHTVTPLVTGAVIGGIGLATIGLLGFSANDLGIAWPYWEATLGVSGMFILGIAHGFINAPVVTHVVTTESVEEIGQSTSVAIYRFLERIGHVAGPLVIAACLHALGGSPLAILYIGGTIVLFGLLFSLPFGRKKTVET